MNKYQLIYQCRNCKALKATLVTNNLDYGQHTFVKNLASRGEIFTSHRCSDVRVGLADLIAVEEV